MTRSEAAIVEAMILVDGLDADLWVVQKATRGPFAEISRVPANLEHRLLTVRGVISARDFVFHTVQREHGGRPLRMAVTGLAWPEDRGAWLPLIAGRGLAQGHFEFIADRSLGLALGETLQLGKDAYTVVGIADGMVSSGGDGLAFFSVREAWASQSAELAGTEGHTQSHPCACRMRKPDLVLRHDPGPCVRPAIGPFAPFSVDLDHGSVRPTIRVTDGHITAQCDRHPHRRPGPRRSWVPR